MRKNRVTEIISIVALTTILLASGILAYITSTDTATNEFTIGNVKIKLTEPNWNEDEAKNIAPNQDLLKDPTIANIGENEAYVYMKITVPVKKVIVANDDGTHESEAKERDLFEYTINSDYWTLITSENGKEIKKEGTEEVVAHTYVYYYNNILAKGETTAKPLFNSVHFVNVIDEQLEDFSKYAIDVDAYAIQSNNLKGATIEAAYAIYVNQTSN